MIEEKGLFDKEPAKENIPRLAPCYLCKRWRLEKDLSSPAGWATGGGKRKGRGEVRGCCSTHSFAGENSTKRGKIPGSVNARCAREKEKGESMKNYFSVRELAEHFNVNPKTIYRRLWAKGIPAYKVGRSWRIARKDIVWLKR